MVGSISKVRPCAHSHYYKYAHAKTHDDLIRTEANINHDYDAEGTFEFSLNNLTTLNKAGIFYNPKLKKIKAETPNLIQINSIIGTQSSLEEIEINWDTVTNCTYAFNGSALKKMPTNFTPNTTNLNGLFYKSPTIITSNNYTLPYSEAIDNATSLGQTFEGTWGWSANIDEQYTFENLVNGGRTFYNTWGYSNAGFVDDFSKNLNFKSLEAADSMFLGHAGLTVINSKEGFPKLKTATSMFSTAPLKHFCPGTDFGLPSLTDASGMFGNSRFDKDSTVRILMSLPSYESGTHRFGIGIAGDLRYDMDVARLLKECDNAYVPPVETLGVFDPTTVSTNKGWALTVAFRGNSTYDEVLHPINFEPQIDIDLELPDGYTRLRYLESDGTQYINTNYIATNTTGMWAIFKSTTEGNSVYVVFAGSWNNNDNSRVFLPHHKTNDTRLYCGYGAVQDFAKWNDAWQHIESRLNWLDSKEGYVRQNTGSAYTKALTTITVAPTVPLYIFGVNKNNALMSGVNGYANGIGRLYRFKISEGEEIVRDFIPVLDSDGRPCMYELIEGAAYYNQGVGADFAHN